MYLALIVIPSYSATAGKIFPPPTWNLTLLSCRPKEKIIIGWRFYPGQPFMASLGMGSSHRTSIINGNYPRACALREEWTCSIRRPFKRVNREAIPSFREENASHENPEPLMADILANSMCKTFSLLKIKQTL